MTIVLPSTPPLNYTGISPTAGPLQQPRLQVSLGNSYPVDVVVTLTLTFAPDSGADDPAIQFSTGGRTTTHHRPGRRHEWSHRCRHSNRQRRRSDHRHRANAGRRTGRHAIARPAHHRTRRRRAHR